MQAAIYFFTAHPARLFRRHRRFYLAYDSFHAALALAFIALKLALRLPALVGRPSVEWLAIFPIAIYAAIVAHLSIHNAVHGNFPRTINRLVGEILGVLVVVRFASWAIVHLRHHRHSDEPGRDPHPNFRSFWTTVFHTVTQVEVQLMREHFDQWGDTPEAHRGENFRAKVSYGVNILILVAWCLCLGPWFFALIFVPANLLGALFIVHFNWVTHNGPRGEGFKPVNLNHGYFWLGNKLFAGIYMHANHHRSPYLYNPALWSEGLLGASEPCIDVPLLTAPLSDELPAPRGH
jgi:fatty acid desaturase